MLRIKHASMHDMIQIVIQLMTHNDRITFVAHAFMCYSYNEIAANHDNGTRGVFFTGCMQ